MSDRVKTHRSQVAEAALRVHRILAAAQVSQVLIRDGQADMIQVFQILLQESETDTDMGTDEQV
jgi:hypothetical protein